MKNKTIEQRISELRKYACQVKEGAVQKLHEKDLVVTHAKEQGLAGKIFKYVSSAAAGVAAGIAGFLAADYVTGGYVTEMFNTAGYIGIALVGAANGVCGEILGNAIARAKYEAGSAWKKINKAVIVHFPIGAAAGGAFSAIASYLGYAPKVGEIVDRIDATEFIDGMGMLVMFGGLAASIPVGYLVGYATRKRK